jgi:hypothetical protein
MKTDQFGRRLEAGQDHPDKGVTMTTAPSAEQQVGKEHFPREADASAAAC